MRTETEVVEYQVFEPGDFVKNGDAVYRLFSNPQSPIGIGYLRVDQNYAGGKSYVPQIAGEGEEFTSKTGFSLVIPNF